MTVPKEGGPSARSVIRKFYITTVSSNAVVHFYFLWASAIQHEIKVSSPFFFGSNLHWHGPSLGFTAWPGLITFETRIMHDATATSSSSFSRFLLPHDKQEQGPGVLSSSSWCAVYYYYYYVSLVESRRLLVFLAQNTNARPSMRVERGKRLCAREKIQ